MYTRLNDPMLKMFNKKIKKFQMQKNSIYISKQVVIEINVEDGLRWLIVGDPGSGKSYLSGIVFNQFKNCLFFDPTDKFRDTIREMDCENKWEFLQLNPKNKKENLKINVRDLMPSKELSDTLFPRAEDTDKKRKQRQAVENFLSMPDKTFDDWEKTCEENKLDALYSDLRWIFSENDSAPSLLETTRGKKCVVCDEVSIRNPSIGVFLQAVISSRRRLSKQFNMNPENFWLCGLDEAQDFCKYQTPVGNSFATLGLQARKYGVGSALIGAAYDNLHPDVRAKSSMKFIFSSPGLTKSYKSEGVDIIQDDWQKLDKYECFLYSQDGRYKGATNNDTCLPSLYFQEIRELNKVPQVTVKKQILNFQPLRRIF
jgi:hypothetical protein